MASNAIRPSTPGKKRSGKNKRADKTPNIKELKA
jgi:hypothetical protein